MKYVLKVTEAQDLFKAVFMIHLLSFTLKTMMHFVCVWLFQGLCSITLMDRDWLKINMSDSLFLRTPSSACNFHFKITVLIFMPWRQFGDIIPYNVSPFRVRLNVRHKCDEACGNPQETLPAHITRLQSDTPCLVCPQTEATSVTVTCSCLIFF